MTSQEPSKKLQIILLIVLIIALISVRITRDHETDFDSYWLHGMAESIQIHKSALWVFHPASLIGFYPMSYPSGTPFFLATFSELTGLSMSKTIMITSIILAIIISLMTFMLVQEIFHSWITSYLSALIIGLSPEIINYTSYNAGGRILIIPFVLLLTYSLIKYFKTKKTKYLTLAVISLLYSLLTHRSVLFTIPIITSFIIAKIYLKIPLIWDYIKNHKHYKKYIKPRYEKSKYYLLLDLGIIITILITIKVMDLLLRGRLMYHISPIMSRVETATSNGEAITMIIITAAAIILILITIILIKILFKKNIIKTTLKLMHEKYHEIFIKPQKYFKYALIIITATLFINQFLGKSFYSPSYNEFQKGLITGSNPIIIFINFIVNYTTSVTITFIFAIIGTIILIKKAENKENNMAQWALIFTTVFFSGLLLDKRYTKIFLTPFIAIISSYGIIRITSWLGRNNKKIIRTIKNPFIITIILLIMIGSQAELIRSQFKEVKSSFTDVSEMWSAGQYLRGFKKDFSTITTKELAAGVIIFASSGVPGASHNIYYYVDKKNLEVKIISLQELKDKIMNGEKIQSLWYLKDWILGGKYYLGRHARYTFNHAFTDEINKKIISDYHEHYYIHDKTLKKNKFLESIEEVKNKVYDNPRIEMYDITKGRA